MASLLAMLAWGLWRRRPWLPVALVLFYLAVVAVPMVLLYAMADNVGSGGMYAVAGLIIFGVLLSLSLISVLLALFVVRTVLGRDRWRRFSPEGARYFSLHVLLGWLTFVSLLTAAAVLLGPTFTP